MNPQSKAAEQKRDHVDYAARVVPLQRWHPNRPAGESTGNVGDARGDESLYKPSTLGQAHCSLREIEAGDNQPFDLVFTAGTHELPTGTRVKFFMAGQGSLGDTPQLDDPDRAGYISINGPKGVRLTPFCDRARVLSLDEGENPPRPPKETDMIVGPIGIGFEISRGVLSKGMTVTWSIGKDAGFRWKKLAGRKEFKVIIEPGNGAPKMRLPEPIVIRILPLDPDHLEALLPMSHEPDDAIRALISMRDCFDNRANWNGSVSVQTGDKTWPAQLIDGMGHVNLPASDTPIQASVVVDAGEFRTPSTSNWAVPRNFVDKDGLRLFIGDMHVHDFNSTAEGYPADVYQWARDEKALDFVAIPIQVHRYIDNEKWVLAKHMNEYFLDEGTFVTFLSFEWQHSHYGDNVIHYLGGDMPYLPIDDERYATPAQLYTALRKTDAFIISHHPGYELDLHVPGTNWGAVENDVDRLLEIWSGHGSSEGVDPSDRPVIPPRRPEGVMGGLRQGVKMGFTGGSDTHTGRPGGSVDDVRPYQGGLCAIWARDLTRRSLFEAFRARRTYALMQSRIVLHFTVNGALMGSEVPAANAYDMKASIWTPSEIKRVQFLRNGSIIHEATPGTPTSMTTFSDSSSGTESCFYHCRVVLTNGQLAVCSPVWAG